MDPRRTNLALIGMRGVGKSNIARRLAFATKRPLLATDVLIEYESGMPIPTYVAEHGWAAFRDLEARVIEKVCRLDSAIIDCGGGVVVDLDPQGHEILSDRKIGLLRRSGSVIYLAGDIARLAAKTKGDARRPSLSELTSAEGLMRAREPFYRHAATEVLDVEGKDRQDIADDLARRYFAILG